MGPLSLGGPVREVDTSGPVDVTAVAHWVTQQPEWHLPRPSRTTHTRQGGNQAGTTEPEGTA